MIFFLNYLMLREMLSLYFLYAIQNVSIKKSFAYVKQFIILTRSDTMYPCSEHYCLSIQHPFYFLPSNST